MNPSITLSKLKSTAASHNPNMPLLSLLSLMETFYTAYTYIIKCFSFKGKKYTLPKCCQRRQICQNSLPLEVKTRLLGRGTNY